MEKEKYTMKELKRMAKERGLKGYSRLRKAELIELLETHFEEQEILQSNDTEKQVEVIARHLPSEVADQRGRSELQTAELFLEEAEAVNENYLAWVYEQVEVILEDGTHAFAGIEITKKQAKEMKDFLNWLEPYTKTNREIVKCFIENGEMHADEKTINEVTTNERKATDVLELIEYADNGSIPCDDGTFYYANNTLAWVSHDDEVNEEIMYDTDLALLVYSVRDYDISFYMNEALEYLIEERNMIARTNDNHARILTNEMRDNVEHSERYKYFDTVHPHIVEVVR